MAALRQARAITNSTGAPQTTSSARQPAPQFSRAAHSFHPTTAPIFQADSSRQHCQHHPRHSNPEPPAHKPIPPAYSRPPAPESIQSDSSSRRPNLEPISRSSRNSQAPESRQDLHAAPRQTPPQISKSAAHQDKKPAPASHPYFPGQQVQGFQSPPVADRSASPAPPRPAISAQPDRRPVCRKPAAPPAA